MFDSKEPHLSVLGVNKRHAARAVKWLRDRSLAAWYRASDGSLNAFEFKGGKEWTYNALNKAIQETK